MRTPLGIASGHLGAAIGATLWANPSATAMGLVSALWCGAGRRDRGLAVRHAMVCDGAM